ncbi:MAG: hypothetical protein ALAOOOJD_00457 [bacterium]|nr:hypothetical protein [bacterium]
MPKLNVLRRTQKTWPWLLFIFVFAAPLAAQEYVIERDDLVSITFWQQPSLNTQSRVGDDGTIDLPVVGRVNAAGYTTAKLEIEIVRQYSFYNAKITQARVSVLEFGSKKVYINGQVTRPGKFTFATMPTIWQVILEAGGPLETANLSQITVVRGSGQDAGKVLTVDLAEALNRNAVNELPRLTPGDIIYVPTTGTVIAGRTPLQQSTLVYVYGEVARPGAFQYEASTNMVQAVINAGGPNPTADLKHVRLISTDSLYTQVAEVDLQMFNEAPSVPPLLLHAGDTIYLPKRRSFLQALGGAFTETYRIVLTTAASVVVYSLARD